MSWPALGLNFYKLCILACTLMQELKRQVFWEECVLFSDLTNVNKVSIVKLLRSRSTS